MDPQTQDQVSVAADVPAEQPASVDNTVQQVADKLSTSKNVLVTVGTNPSVDELASALGLTMLLNKLSKHVTAVFSGKIPSAMEFLDPQTTFEDNVDSLRDFIIALDKEKADKLRYKVEDDVVKIFITPYQTVITEKDLEFSQGDFNVDVVVALGVQKREALDAAILAHGRILHDAEVITITAQLKSNLGSIDWCEEGVSSIAEMLVRLSAVLGEDLIDEQIGTALLTGIVAETNRFSNEKTSPAVMTIAAQLMARGANQQLIATNLRQEGMISESIRTKDTTKAPSSDDNGEMVLNHAKDDRGTSESKKQPNNQKKPAENQNQKQPKQPLKDGNAPKPVNADQQAQSKPARPPEPPRVTETEPVPLPKPATAEGVSAHKPKVIEPLPDSVAVIPEPVSAPQQPAQEVLPVIQPVKSASITEPPQFGGTLNATVDSGVDSGDIAIDPLSNSGESPLFEHADTAEAAANTDALEEARRAVEMAAFEPAPVSAPAPVAPSMQDSLQPVMNPAVDTTVAQTQSASPPPLASVMNQNSSPVDDFMQPHVATDFAAASMNTTNVATPPLPSESPQPPGLPPLPPLPGGGAFDGLPPLPPLPGGAVDQAAIPQPQINPAFMTDMNQSQNHLTEQGQQLTDQYAQRETVRQEKIETLGQQYDSAVEKNRELQGLPPVNDHTTFPLPPPPQAQ